MAYCWDCETEIPGGTYCRSCQLHRASCPTPIHYQEHVAVTDERGHHGQLYRDAERKEWVKAGRVYYRHGKRGRPVDPRPVVMSWYCHGAGPDGNRPEMLKQSPRPLRESEIRVGVRPPAVAQ
jgi:hypothetical protein